MLTNEGTYFDRLCEIVAYSDTLDGIITCSNMFNSSKVTNFLTTQVSGSHILTIALFISNLIRASVKRICAFIGALGHQDPVR